MLFVVWKHVLELVMTVTSGYIFLYSNDDDE